MSDNPAAQPELSANEPLPWDKWLEPGDHILCSHMSAEPRALLLSLAKAKLPDNLSIELGVPFSPDAIHLPAPVSLQVMGGMGAAGALSKQRPTINDREEYLSILLDYASGRRRADVVLVSLAQDKDGSLHLGASHGPVLEAARHARLVIAEINKGAPVIKGSTWPDEIKINSQFPCNYSIAGIATAATKQNKAHELQIASHLAELIPDNACLQVGIGSLPSAILDLLKDHHNLGIHTGMLSESLYELITCGAVDNSNKPTGLQHSITGSVFGSTSFYSEVSKNNQVLLASPSQTHALEVLQTINNLTTINSAIEVDLAGRVNAETIKTSNGDRRYVGGVGGLPAFVRGAKAAKNGMSVIALPALTDYSAKPDSDKAKSTARSRIVRSLQAEVTLDETMADVVVTEYGVANLRDATPAQRKQRMIDIASPDFRDWLQQ